MEGSQNTTQISGGGNPNDVLTSQPVHPTQVSQQPQEVSQQAVQPQPAINTPVVPQVPKKKKNPMIYVLLFLLLILALLFVANMFKNKKPGVKKEEKKVGSTATPEPTNTTSSDGELAVIYGNVDWKAPTKYIYQKKGGELIVGVLGENEEYNVTESKGNFGFLNAVSVSPSGNYLVYLRLPDEKINEYNETPPYEFYGSNMWDLHFVDINNLKNIKDSIVMQGVEYYVENHDIYFWETNSTKLYILKSYDYSAKKSDVQVYDYRNKDSSKYDGEFQKFNALAFSPEGNYLKLVEKERKDNSINYYYNLDLYSSDGSFVKTLYTNFISAGTEIEATFPNEKTIYLTREDFIHEGDSVCYIEQISIESGNVTELQKKDCPPDQSYTSYHKPTLSPDGRYAVATYAEGKNGSLFVYDLVNKTGKEFANQDGWIDKYWWMSKNQIAIHIPSGRYDVAKDKTYIVNVETGDVVEDPTFTDKAIDEIF